MPKIDELTHQNISICSTFLWGTLKSEKLLILISDLFNWKIRKERLKIEFLRKILMTVFVNQKLLKWINNQKGGFPSLMSSFLERISKENKIGYTRSQSTQNWILLENIIPSPYHINFKIQEDYSSSESSSLGSKQDLQLSEIWREWKRAS